ncbi:MAG: hypothetical protein R3B72_36040 [Polyangiaceae bacterium]
MREEHKILPVPAEVAAADALRIANWRDASVQLYGSFAATIAVEVKLHPDAEWQTVASETGPAIVAIPDGAHSLRVNTTAFTSGAPGAALGGWVS